MLSQLEQYQITLRMQFRNHNLTTQTFSICIIQCVRSVRPRIPYPLTQPWPQRSAQRTEIRALIFLRTKQMPSDCVQWLQLAIECLFVQNHSPGTPPLLLFPCHFSVSRLDRAIIFWISFYFSFHRRRKELHETKASWCGIYSALRSDTHTQYPECHRKKHVNCKEAKKV